LRKIKCKQLHEDLKAIKRECDESIQRKNAVIRNLLADLDESEEIYSAMLHSHMNIIEKLIGNGTRGKRNFPSHPTRCVDPLTFFTLS
jgi:predicted ATP-grasp superfamily ATP-dependent carboligase